MNEQEFTDLINKHKGIINKACNTYCQSLSHADLTQEIIIETWQSLNNFKKNCNFSTWLYYIARNVCISALRKHKKGPEVIGLEEYADVLAETSNTEEMVKQLRQAIKYNAVIDNLEEPDRSLFEMYLHGASYEEMEQQTGVSQNILRVKLHRINRKLHLRYGNGNSIK